MKQNKQRICHAYESDNHEIKGKIYSLLKEQADE